jgi:redox-sensitive bicupin YhaK (pirin superfamily)
MIGPWCFLDLVGPLSFTDPAMDVPPHPHIGLQTVTWLLEGEMLHKDSLGREALARPGTLNLMTSGRGLAHSEETPALHSGRLHAVQLWVALPDATRDIEPAFDEYPTRPVVELAGGRATLLVGELAGVRAEARTFSPIVGVEVTIDPGAELVLPLTRGFEHGLVPLLGECTSGSEALAKDHLYGVDAGTEALRLRAGNGEAARLLLVGGAPFGEEILMWWNFVARTSDEVVAAREDWQAHRRFGEVVRYGGGRLEAPPFRARTVPANPMS